MTPEKKVKNKVVAVLKAYEAYYFFPATGGYGVSGVPDVVGCYKGKFFAIECKAGVNKPTALQDRNMQKIKDNGGLAIVVNEENQEAVENLLRGIDETKGG